MRVVNPAFPYGKSLMSTLVTGLAFVITVPLCCAPAQAGQGEPVNISQKLAAYQELLSQASTPQDQSTILDALEATARDVFSQSRPASGDFMLNVANVLRRHGHDRQALDLIDEVIGMPQSSRQMLSALNNRAMFGQSSFRESPEEYNPFHKDLLDRLDDYGRDVMPEARAQMLFINSLGQLANSSRHIEDAEKLDDLVLTVDWALSRDWINWSGEGIEGGEGLVVSAILAAADVHEKTGNTAMAQSLRQSVLDDFPEWESDSDFRTMLRLKTARASEPLDTDSPDVVENLQGLWNDPEVREGPVAMTVASNLISALRAADALDVAIVVAIDASVLYLENEQEWAEVDGLQGEAQPDWIREQNQRRAAGLMYRALQNPHWREYAEELLPIADAFLERFEDHNLAGSVERRRDLIIQYLASQ